MRSAVRLAILLAAAAAVGCGPSGRAPGRFATVDDLLTSTYGAIPDLPRPDGLTGAAFARAKDLLRAGTERVADATVEEPGRTELETIGDLTVKQAAGDLRRSGDSAGRDRVAAILDRLTGALPDSSVNRYRFALYDSEQVNAFMACGGRGMVLTGLLEAMPGDDELAFVLAHELSHGELGHAEHQYRLAKAGVALTERFRDGTDGRLEVWASKIVTAVYDQDMEFEADRLGFALAVAAGYPEAAAERALGVLDRLGGSHAAPENGAGRVAYDIRATHPPVPDRIAYARTLASLLRR